MKLRRLEERMEGQHNGGPLSGGTSSILDVRESGEVGIDWDWETEKDDWDGRVGYAS